MSSFNPAEIVRATEVNHVEYHETLDSTNTLAVELLADLMPLAPALVLTSNQAAGRGRGSNQWWATSGALTFSLVLSANDLQLPTHRLSLISLAVGLGVRNAVATTIEDRPVGVKWPNDVLIGDHKVGGILVEQHSVAGEAALVIGIGLNVNNSLATAPDEVQRRATSLFDLTAEHTELNDLLVSVINQVTKSIAQLQRREMEMFAELNSVSSLTRRVVSVQAGDDVVTGLCRGIDSDGCLLIEQDGRLSRMNAGTVLKW